MGVQMCFRLPDDLSIPVDLWVVLFGVGCVFGCEITLSRRPVYRYRPVGGVVWCWVCVWV